MVQRYELTEDFCGGVAVTPVPEEHNGSWVAYEDYAALEEAYAQLQERYDLDVNPEGK